MTSISFSSHARRIAGACTALLIAASCTPVGEQQVVGPDLPFERIDVLPRPSSILELDSARFEARAVSTAGTEIPSVRIAWGTADTSVVELYSDGQIIGLQPGDATIYATAYSASGTQLARIPLFLGIRARKVESVAVLPSTPQLTAGETTRLSALALDKDFNTLRGRLFTWSVDDPAIASVSSSGVVTARAAGVTRVTATAIGTTISGTATATVVSAPVARVIVQPATAAGVVGDTLSFSARAEDGSGNPITGKNIVWTSSAPSIASVSSSGRVILLSAGPAVISARVDGVTGTAAVTSTIPAVASVSLNPLSSNLTPGGTVQLNVLLKDNKGRTLSGRPVVYSSSAPGVATVNVKGLVSAVAQGNATISATSEGITGTATVAVSNVAVASVIVNPGSTSLQVGNTANLSAIARSSGGTVLAGRPVSWSSSNVSAATVNAAGVVTAVAPGVATVTANIEGGTGSSTVTVTAVPLVVASVSLTGISGPLTIGAQGTLSAVARTANGTLVTGRAISWSSGTPAVATVNAAGVVTALSVGTTVIKAIIDGVEGQQSVTVTPVAVASVVVSPDSLEVTQGSVGQFTGTVRDVNGNVLAGRVVTWTSTTPSVATVSNTGQVTGVSVGNSYITMASEGKTYTSRVWVVAPTVQVASVSVTPPGPSVTIGATVALTATPRDAGGNAITGKTATWTSLTPATATVSATGVVTGVAVGTATIRASVDGVNGQTTVSVTALPAASLTLTPPTASMNVGATSQLTAVVRNSQGAVIAGAPVTYATSNASRATVSATGLVTGVSVGSASIIATSGSVADTTAVTITAAPATSITLTPASISMNVGGTSQLTAVVRDAQGAVVSGATVTFSSTNTSRATVSASGLVTGVSAGTASVIAASGALRDTTAVTVTAPPQTASINMTVNTSSQFTISRFIYGMNATTDVFGAGYHPWYGAQPPAEVTLDRFGGNRLSAYNWETNYSNAGNDFSYSNDSYLSTSTTAGEAVRGRVAASRSRGAAAMVTVPMLGYVAGDNSGSTDILDATRATRLATRFKQSLPTKGSAFTLNPSKTDAFVYQDEFVNWLNTSFPGAITDPTRPIFISLDNEPDIWHSTHKEVMSDSSDNPNRPRLQSYNGFIATSVAYSTAIKNVAPGAMIFGPATATYAGIASLGRWPSPDPVHGTANFFDVYLAGMKQASNAAGKRLLDVLDFHYYPAAGTGAGEITNDYLTQDASMIQARVQSPRSLWDPTYNEGSWVNQTVGGNIQLLPRIRNQIAAHYPGTKISISEYYYGRAGDISGGVAQADVLGIYGREGVFAATFWPQVGIYASPYNGNGALAFAYAFGAFRMFLNYDGAGGQFGSTGVQATTSDIPNSSVYASLNAAGQVVLIMINKATSAKTTAVAVNHGGTLNTARVYTMTNGSPNPTRQADVALSAGNQLLYTMPAMSVSTLVLVP